MNGAGREIRITNDTNCFALSEASDGRDKGRGGLGAILGTGVGGGIVVRGDVLDGPNAIAGEWGHNPLPWPRDDERPGGAVLLRQARLHRNLGVRPWDRTDHLQVTGDRTTSIDTRPGGSR